jgi:hypothetical protein
MLTGIHVLLTYRCPYECDHCFLHCGPHSEGTFTRARLAELLDQAVETGTVEQVYFEGGEPTLYWPLLLEGIRRARARGLTTGLVTNAYWAETVDDAALWLADLRDAGLGALTLSDDRFHGGDAAETPAARARAAAERLGMDVGTICIPHPEDDEGVRFRGRAADTLTAGRPPAAPDELTSCPDEDLADPGRVHVDAFGNVHLCQGLLLGNVWEKPLGRLLAEHDAAAHPIFGPLIRGGPAALAREHGVEIEETAVSACHLCYLVRKSLLDRFPEHLGPAAVYGIRADRV